PVAGGTKPSVSAHPGQERQALPGCSAAIHDRPSRRSPTVPSHEYRPVTHRDVQGTPGEAYAIIDDALGLVRWWPSVDLDARGCVLASDRRGSHELPDV